MRRPIVSALLLLVACVAAPVRAQTAPADTGRFVIFQGDTPMAREKNAFQWMGDSLVITAYTQRTVLDDKGARHPWTKSVVLVVDSRDLGLKSYVSIQDYLDSKLTRGLIPGDTSISYYAERDGEGNAARFAQPPGRLYVMDSSCFTLFEVICRSLAPKTFTQRPVQLLALGDSLDTPVATVTRGAVDTLRLGPNRVIARHYTFADPNTSFELWADSRGRMLKLTHESGLRVEREPDRIAPARRRARGTR